MKTSTVARLTAGTIAVAAVLATAPSAALGAPNAPLAVPSANGSFTPLTPARVLDTRNGIGAPKAPVAGQHTVTFTVNGNGGVPASGVSAVVLNVTVLGGSSSGFITAYPGGTTRPAASNLNFAAKQTVPNLVVVKVNAGQVSLYNGSSQPVNLLADVAGYYLDGAVTDAGAFQALAPARILDTRNAIGATGHKAVPSLGTVNLTVTGAGGVPSSGVSAVVMNVTAVSGTKSGFITVYPSNQSRPAASNLNYVAGRAVPNLVTVGLSGLGKVTLYNGSAGSVHLLADVAGYYLAGTPTKQGTFVPVTPTRLLDTRSAGLGTPSNHPVPSLKNVGLQILDGHTVPVDGVSAVVTNVTSVAATKSGYVTVYPTAPTRPVASNINHVANQTIANLAIVQPGLCGQATFFNGSAGTTHLLADVAGYFLGGNSGTASGHNVFGVGVNDGGELGDGSRTNAAHPVQALGLHDIAQVSGDGLAVTHDGGVWAWGPEELASLYNGGPSTDVGFGNCSIPERLNGFQGAVPAAVAGTPSDGYVLDLAQHVWSFGLNDEGQLGRTGSADFEPAKVNISAGHKIIQITPGFALEDNGDVWGWGDNSEGQLGTGISGSFSAAPNVVAGLSGVLAIAQHGDTEYALLSDHSVVAWGSNADGALGNNSNVANSSTPVAVAGVGGTGTLTAVQAISGGMALLNDGTVVTWGSNDNGRLGNSTIGPSSKFPVAITAVTGMPTFQAIAGGADHSVALGTDGTVWSWGAAFADGSGTRTGSPNEVTDSSSTAISGITAIGAGVGTTFAIN